jgi:hypothetical protein
MSEMDFPVVARIVRRDNDDETDGLLLGVTMKSRKDFFKKGHIYEIQEYEGDVFIVDKGLSNLRRDGYPSWQSTPDIILSCTSLFHTNEELQKVIKDEEEERRTSSHRGNVPSGS